MEENTSKVYVGPAASLLREPLLAAGAGSPLFVINLCASIAPIAVAGKTIPGLESYRLYQVARNEDGRTRHRLRLGFFTSEEDADRVLASVRNSYPTAFTTCLGDDDRKFARGFLPDSAAAAPVRQRPVAVESVPPRSAKPAAAVVTANPAVATAAPKPATAASKPPATTATAAAPTAAAKGKVAASLDEAVDLELSWDPPALQTAAPVAKQVPPAATASVQTLPPVFKTEPVIKSKPAQTTPAPMKAAAKPAPAEPVAPIELTLANETVAAKPQSAPARAQAQPFHVGKGVEIPAMSLSLETQSLKVTPPAAPASSAPAVKPAAAAHNKAAVVPAAPARTATPPSAVVPSAVMKEPIRKAPTPTATSISAAPPARATHFARPPADTDRSLPELDSTQTIRALTSAELNDDSQEKCFAIQLVVSEQPVNLDAMPHLDIFEAYRLYSVANAGSGKILHSLRIGFFREEVSAEAVCGYLKTFFPSPSVLRISTAEQLRFKDAPVPKAVAAKNDSKVIELNHARERAPRTVVPTVTMEVAAPNNGADRSPTGMFKTGATGTFTTNASGSYRVNATGSHKALNPALKPAAKSAGPATKRSSGSSKTSVTGKYKALPKKSLSQQLLEEAREVELSESAIRKLPKNDSLLSRLVGKLTK